MIYTEMTKKALKLCFTAHQYQTDKSGLPYVFHPFHVAEQMQDEVTTTVALLHDLVEDTPYTFEDLAKMGFPPVVIDNLKLLTHAPDMPYSDYIARIKGHPVAVAVKLADLAHNSDVSRYTVVDDRAKARLQKYQQAMKQLTES